MIKGTINTPDFYGKIESIESQISVSVGDTLVNKASGVRFIVNTITVTKDKNKNLELTYSITRKHGMYMRTIPYETLKYYYWKVA